MKVKPEPLAKLLHRDLIWNNEEIMLTHHSSFTDPTIVNFIQTNEIGNDNLIYIKDHILF